MSEKTPVLLFHHVPKTGGSTFINMLESDGYWSPRPLSDCTDIRRLAAEVKMAATIGPALPPLFVYGHNSTGVEDVFPDSYAVQSLIFIRNPRSLLLSNFRFRTDQNMIGAHKAFEDYLASSAPRNPMTDFLGGGNLKCARENLAAITHICLVEDYAGAVSRLAGPLHLQNRTYPLRKKSHTPCEPSPQAEELIRAISDKDQVLYQYAQELLLSRPRPDIAEADRVTFYEAEDSGTEPPEALPMEQAMLLRRDEATQDMRDRARWTLLQPGLGPKSATPSLQQVFTLQQLCHLDDRHTITYAQALAEFDPSKALAVCVQFLRDHATLALPRPEAHYNRAAERVWRLYQQIKAQILAASETPPSETQP